MRERNISFQEKYKSVDNFIKDAYGTSEGVTTYIRTMESPEVEWRIYSRIPNWNSDYKQLKRLRWIRNQLAHEVSIDSDICTEEDYEWICEFRESLFKGTDSMALYTRLKNIEEKKQKSKPTSEKKDNIKEQSGRVHTTYYHPLPEGKKKAEKNGGFATLLIWILLILFAVLVVKIISLL